MRASSASRTGASSAAGASVGSALVSHFSCRPIVPTTPRRADLGGVAGSHVGLAMDGGGERANGAAVGAAERLFTPDTPSAFTAGTHKGAFMTGGV
eukprot:ctg_578.g255